MAAMTAENLVIYLVDCWAVTMVLQTVEPSVEWLVCYLAVLMAE